MSNLINTTGTTSKLVATRNTNFKIGIGGSDDYGPTSVTNFYNGITPPIGGYTIYVQKELQGPSIHVAQDDNQCIFFLKSFGATGETINEVLNWSTGRTDMWVQTNDLTSSDIDVPIFSNPTLTIGSSILESNSSPFSGGGKSYEFFSSIESYITTPGSNDWAVGTGDFTVEWFSYQKLLSQFQRIFTVGDYPTIKIGVSIESGTFYYWANNIFRYSQVFSTFDNIWYHFAVVRQNGITIIYRNGTRIGTQITDTNNITENATPFVIGNTNTYAKNAAFNGFLTNFRFVKGLGVYTGNFTKPTSQLTAISSANPYGGSNTLAVPSGFTKLLIVP